MGAAAVLTAGALAIGCSDDGGDTIIGGGLLATDNFPGSSVSSNNLADDQRAFSNSGQNITGGEIFWNCENRQAIGLFTTAPVSGSQSEILYAAWFDGNAWHRPVEIGGDTEASNSGVIAFKALWLNTAGNADAEAAAHNGDAIILFTRSDAPIPGDADEDQNVRLYGTIFDVSQANAPAFPGFQGGFDTIASAIDDPTIANNGGTGTFGDEDPDVSAFGFVSDSLCCTHEFTSDSDPVDSGETTTFVHIIWNQNVYDNSDPDTNEVNFRWHSVQVDFSTDGDFVTTTTPAVIDVPFDDGAIAETVSDEAVVHNGVMYWTANGMDTGTSTDQFLMASIFTAAAATSTDIELSSDADSAESDDTNDTAELPDPENVYGEDHGLRSHYAFYGESGYGDESGERSFDRDLMMARLDVAATGAITEAANSPIEIDAFTDSLVNDITSATDDTDDDDIAELDGDNGDVGQIETRINRTATAIFVLFTQENTNESDADDTDATIGLREPNFVPFVTVVQTRRDSADVRTVANSVDLPPLNDTSVLESDQESGGTGDDQGDVNSLDFQAFLAQGQAESQNDDESCNPACNIQGNANRMSWTFVQNNDVGAATDNDNNRLFLNGATVTLDTTGTAAPALALTNAGATEVDEVDSGYSGNLFDRIAVDAGDASASAAGVPTAAAGRVNVFFVAQDIGNDELDTSATAGFDEPRLFVSEQAAGGTAGAKTLVSSDPATGSQTDSFLVNGLEAAIIVPPNTNTTATPHYSGERLFVFWTENRNLPGSGDTLMTRSHEQRETTQANPAVALVDRFDPPLPASPDGENPVQIDNPTSGDLGNLPGDNVTVLNDGSTVGVYFDEDRHIYFTDSSVTARDFDYEAGIPAPQIVDNETFADERVLNYVINFTSGPDCNPLRKSQAQWTKNDGGSGHTRAQVRVHN